MSENANTTASCCSCCGGCACCTGGGTLAKLLRACADALDPQQVKDA